MDGGFFHGTPAAQLGQFVQGEPNGFHLAFRVGHDAAILDNDEEGWSYDAPAIFTQPTGQHNSGRLEITTNDNSNSFGFWESPMFTIGSDDVTRGILIGGSTGSSSLFRTTFNFDSNVVDQSMVPTIRGRSSSADFQQSDVYVVTSAGNGAFSPSAAGTDYVQYFSQPAGQDQFRLDFDVLNFDTTDSAVSTTGLGRVVVEALTSLTLTDEIIVTSPALDFSGMATNGFTSRDAAPAITAPLFAATNDGLEIRGRDAALLGGSVDNIDPDIFGFWGAETTIPFNADRLYRVAFTVTTDAVDAEDVPAYRLRANDSSLQFSAYVNIESQNQGSRIPTAGNSETYFLWIQSPAGIAGNSWIFSFDYLYSQVTGNDPTIRVTLQSLEVRSYEVP